jgi:hypothetical protein
MSDKQPCSHTIIRNRRETACIKGAHYEHEGRWYCAHHYPPKVEEIRLKRLAARAAKKEQP